MCKVCSCLGQNVGISITKGQRKDSAFVSGTVVDAKNANVLLKKIDKHRDSKMHTTCCQIIDDRNKQNFEKALSASEQLFNEQNKAKIDVTEKLFRTAYECASSHLSFISRVLSSYWLAVSEWVGLWSDSLFAQELRHYY